jgi:hypothetical protein
MKTIEYVDLGLPSGTLWASHNAHIGKKYHFTYDEAMEHFGDRMPNYDQYKELLNLCKWEWIKLFGGKVQGYKITGPNHNSIFLSASGYYHGTSLYDRGSYGDYWSARYDDSSYAYYLYFGSSNHSMSYYFRYYGFSVRTIKTKRHEKDNVH